MKYIVFLAKLCICLLLLLCTDYLFGKAADYCIAHQKSGDYFEFDYKVFHAKPAVVILGSSRANHHYNTLLIQKKLQQRTMNYGADGSEIFYDYIILKTLVRRSVPQTVILDVRPFEFVQKPSGEAIVALYPFFNKMNITREDLTVISPYEFVKVKLNSYRYNNILLSALLNMKGKQTDTAAITGYTPLPPTKNIFIKHTEQFETVNATSFYYFTQIAAICKQYHIRLVVCISPYYNYVSSNKTAAAAQQFCRQHSIAFYNYCNNSLLPFTKSSFRDNLHLNTIGADIFTSDFISRALQQQ